MNVECGRRERPVLVLLPTDKSLSLIYSFLSSFLCILTPALIPASTMAALSTPVARINAARTPSAARAGRRRSVAARARPGTSTTGDPAELASAVAVLDAHVARVGGADLYAATEEATKAVDVMVRSNDIGGTLEECLARSDGVWEVCVMPHMLNLSAPLGIRFKVRYSLEGGKIRSDVRFRGPGGIGRGWLSSSGRVEPTSRTDHDGAAIDLVFERFWIDLEDGEDPKDFADCVSAVDGAIDAIGRLGFLPSFAFFPVHFFDAKSGTCVFEFPPLRSNIAAKRVGDVDDGLAFE